MAWKDEEIWGPLADRATAALEAMAANPPEPDPMEAGIVAGLRACRELAADRDVLSVAVLVRVCPVETQVQVRGLLTPGTAAELEIHVDRHSGALQKAAIEASLPTEGES